MKLYSLFLSILIFPALSGIANNPLMTKKTMACKAAKIVVYAAELVATGCSYAYLHFVNYNLKQNYREAYNEVHYPTFADVTISQKKSPDELPSILAFLGQTPFIAAMGLGLYGMTTESIALIKGIYHRIKQ